MLIALAGCDGAGKTTLVARVADWLAAEGVDVELIDKWDVYDLDRHPECRFIGQPRDQLPFCISRMTSPARAMFLFWLISVTLMRRDLTAPDRIFITDGYWMKHAAAETVYGCDHAFIESMIEQFPPADLTVFLQVAPELALRRKPALVPYECGLDEALRPESFLAHQRRVTQVMTEYARRFGWQTLAADRDADLVFADVKRIVQSALARYRRSL